MKSVQPEHFNPELWFSIINNCNKWRLPQPELNQCRSAQCRVPSVAFIRVNDNYLPVKRDNQIRQAVNIIRPCKTSRHNWPSKTRKPKLNISSCQSFIFCTENRLHVGRVQTQCESVSVPLRHKQIKSPVNSIVVLLCVSAPLPLLLEAQGTFEAYYLFSNQQAICSLSGQLSHTNSMLNQSHLISYYH